MVSNNGLTICNSKFVSFINKGFMTLLFTFLLIIIIPPSYLVIAYWVEMPVVLKLFWTTLVAVVLMGVIITPLNGMVFNKNGSILFIPDFRIIRCKAKDLDRIVFNFNEWDNKKYSVMVKIVYKGGNYFSKDYSRQFRNMRNKKLSMSMYTISRYKLDKICNIILQLDFCTVINIMDSNGNIVYQYLPKL
ncbi:MAG: hypothetical protein E7453_04810 [Ruminococcaceae bacterium]|nr:hypothetical protein [Oscillospiraceae bacterium]